MYTKEYKKGENLNASIFSETIVISQHGQGNNLNNQMKRMSIEKNIIDEVS